MKPDARRDIGLLILRLGLGLVITFYGSQKMLGVFGGQGYAASVEGFTNMGFHPALANLAIAGEFFGGLGVLAGCLTPIAALGVAATMSVAAYKGVTATGAMTALLTSGNPADASKVLYPLSLGMSALALIFLGAGAYSIDARIFKRSKK